MIEVTDNFLPQSVFDDTKNFSNIILWGYCGTYSADDDPEKNFAYMVGSDSLDGNFFKTIDEFSHYISTFISHKYNFSKPFRIRWGLITRDTEYKVHTPHVDFEGPHYSALIYLTGDGPTYFYEEDRKTVIKKIEPLPNRLVVFDGSIPHSSSTPVESKERIVINFNFDKENM